MSREAEERDDIGLNFGPIDYRVLALNQELPHGPYVTVEELPFVVGAIAGYENRRRRVRDGGSHTWAAYLLREAERRGVEALSIDRRKLLSFLEQDIDPGHYLVAVGLYTNLVQTKGNYTRPSDDRPVVHQTLRRDLQALLAKGEAIFTTLDEADQGPFMEAMGANFIPKIALFDHPALTSITFIDILEHPDSLVSLDQRMALRVLRAKIHQGVIERRQRRVNASLDSYTSFCLEPLHYARNPDLLLVVQDMIEEGVWPTQKNDNQLEFAKLAGGTIDGIFQQIQAMGRDPEEYYPAKLALAYFALNANLRINNEAVFIEDRYTVAAPRALVQLATGVAEATGSPAVFGKITPNEAYRAFEFLLPYIEFDHLWPELRGDTEKMDCIKQAFCAVVARGFPQN
jgi:hypothetical protein